jgi:hypothetical protein
MNPTKNSPARSEASKHVGTKEQIQADLLLLFGNGSRTFPDLRLHHHLNRKSPETVETVAVIHEVA